MSTWIFLRGLNRESRHWGSFPETFRQAVPEADVHTIDLPGNGRLHRLKSPADVAEMAESCRAQLLASGILPPYHVLAMSLGAMVTIAWAARHPAEIRGCVLINTSRRQRRRLGTDDSATDQPPCRTPGVGSQGLDCLSRRIPGLFQ